jgi:hypothetical protein
MGGDSDLEALTQLFANGHFSGEIAVLFLSLNANPRHDRRRRRVDKRGDYQTGGTSGKVNAAAGWHCGHVRFQDGKSGEIAEPAARSESPPAIWHNTPQRSF